MTEQERIELFRYLDKYSEVFNEMFRELVERITFFPDHIAADNENVWPEGSIQSMANAKVNTELFVQQQLRFLERQQHLWQSFAKSINGENAPPIIVEDESDKRFSDEAWKNHPSFSYIKQAYLLSAEYLTEMVAALEFEDKKISQQVRFYTRQCISCSSPSNYLFTNPEVCREVLDSKGANLAKGINNFMRDLRNSPDEAFRLTQVDHKAFSLGGELANTPGHIVFQNRLIQLIQYRPSRENTFAQPLLFIPPFINKYYILDLGEKKSLIRWLLDQGFTVFMVSWVNPGSELAQVGFDNYVQEGVIEALDAVESITACSKINVAGYCVGGTLLAATQAYLLARGDKRISSLTFLASLFDFSEPGEIGSYISELSYPVIENMIRNKGYLDGRVLALGFSLLRENSLFWAFFIENYLKGKDPEPFDILYWNSDSSNIPGALYLFYLRNMYLDNKFKEAGGIQLNGIDIDLASITTPSYTLAAKSDHIVLWQAAYSSVQCVGGCKRFVLTESGHVAGIVNPVNNGKYPYWVNPVIENDHKSWLAGAKQKQGSWWQDWSRWLQQYSGELAAPPSAGNEKYPVLEEAPGSYVKVRLEAGDEKNNI